MFVGTLLWAVNMRGLRNFGFHGNHSSELQKLDNQKYSEAFVVEALQTFVCAAGLASQWQNGHIVAAGAATYS